MTAGGPRPPLVDGSHWPHFVDEWANNHEEIDREGLSDALLWAGTSYSGGGLYEDDTLDKIEKPAAELLKLLSIGVNRWRLIDDLVGERRLDVFDVIDEVVDEFDAMLRQLDAVRRVAARHTGGARVKLPGKQDLRGAYAVLARFCKRSFGDEAFTQEWAKLGGELVPISLASRFIHNAMKLIDPDRPRLAAELQYLMQIDIEGMPGDRRGRRKNLS